MTASSGLHGLGGRAFWSCERQPEPLPSQPSYCSTFNDCIGLDRDRGRAEGEYPWRGYCRAHCAVLLVALAANR